MVEVSIPSEFTLLSNAFYVIIFLKRFQYPLNLHCSQTTKSGSESTTKVSIPSEFTLLSNKDIHGHVDGTFQYPLNLHCSQTQIWVEPENKSFNTL